MVQWQKSILLRSAGAQIKRQLRENLRETGPDMVEILQVIVGLPQPPSKPGEPPHRTTDRPGQVKEHLQDSIDWVFEEVPGVMAVHVGSEHAHAEYTEFGPKYPARPWLRPFFANASLNGEAPLEQGILFPVLFHGF